MRNSKISYSIVDESLKTVNSQSAQFVILANTREVARNGEHTSIMNAMGPKNFKLSERLFFRSVKQRQTNNDKSQGSSARQARTLPFTMCDERRRKSSRWYKFDFRNFSNDLWSLEFIILSISALTFRNDSNVCACFFPFQKNSYTQGSIPPPPHTASPPIHHPPRPSDGA